KTSDEENYSSAQGNPLDKKQLRQQAADIRKQLAPLKKVISALEAKVAKLDEKLATIDHQLADVSLYEEGNKEQLQSLLVEKGTLNQQKEDLEERWMAQLEQLEAMEVALGL